MKVIDSFITIIFLMLLIISSPSCRSDIRKLPVETSFGKLISVEMKKSVETDEKKLNPEPGIILYLLTFEGEDTISFISHTPTRDIKKAFTPILETVRLNAPLIVDLKTKTQYIPVFIGTKDNSQKIIAPIAWGINVAFENFTWTGSLITDPSGLTLVFLIPEKVRNFSIKDHENEFRIR